MLLSRISATPILVKKVDISLQASVGVPNLCPSDLHRIVYERQKTQRLGERHDDFVGSICRKNYGFWDN